MAMPKGTIILSNIYIYIFLDHCLQLNTQVYCYHTGGAELLSVTQNSVQTCLRVFAKLGEVSSDLSCSAAAIQAHHG